MKDKLGRELKVDDVVAYTWRQGSSHEIEIGVVREVKPNGKVRVEVFDADTGEYTASTVTLGTPRLVLCVA